jgi:hypothetical protein
MKSLSIAREKILLPRWPPMISVTMTERSTTSMIRIMWLDGEEHPWFFIHEVPTEERHKLQTRLPTTKSQDEIRQDSSHKASSGIWKAM